MSGGTPLPSNERAMSAVLYVPTLCVLIEGFRSANQARRTSPLFPNLSPNFNTSIDRL
jgi:hypothetical protein